MIVYSQQVELFVPYRIKSLIVDVTYKPMPLTFCSSYFQSIHLIFIYVYKCFNINKVNKPNNYNHYKN